jgi:threonine/homoserine/homoserine lactone efflux protein
MVLLFQYLTGQWHISSPAYTNKMVYCSQHQNMVEIAMEALLAAGTVFFLGAISPGPSLIVVLRNTMLGGRKQGVACAFGHGIGFGIYAISAVFGLVILLDKNPQIFQILQLIGILLLVYYGWKMWHAIIKEKIDEAGILNSVNQQRQGFMEGFSIAFFNPKIALFLVAVLAQVLKPGMTIETKVAVGLLGMFIDTTWYLIVALALTGTPALETLRNNSLIVNRVTAVVLWAFATAVLVAM